MSATIAVCVTCWAEIAPDEDTGLCDTCQIAWRDGTTIEEARLEVEQSAAFWTQHLGRAEGRRCSCDVVDHVFVEGPKTKGRGPSRTGVIHFEVTHKAGCPLAPPTFEWPEVDEEGRERVFGYEGRERHGLRLLGAMREMLADREWER